VDYLFDSKSTDHICAFLSIPNSKSKQKLSKKQKHYMKFFNAQMCGREGRCFIEFFMELVESEKSYLVDDLKVHMMYYFEEIGDVEIETKDEIIESLIDTVFESMSGVKEQSGLAQYTEYIRTLRFMIMFWQPTGEHYEHYKKRIVEMLPSHELFFWIVEGKYDDFFQHFEKKVDELKIKSRLYTEEFYFDLFYLALRKEQKKIINFIVKRYSFGETDTYFPDNIKVTKIHRYAAMKLMHHGDRFVKSNFPREWFTIDLLIEFLDSRVTVYNQDYNEMNLKFISGNVRKILFLKFRF
jgi:hypothetical protein